MHSTQLDPTPHTTCCPLTACPVSDPGSCLAQVAPTAEAAASAAAASAAMPPPAPGRSRWVPSRRGPPPLPLSTAKMTGRVTGRTRKRKRWSPTAGSPPPMDLALLGGQEVVNEEDDYRWGCLGSCVGQGVL